MDGMQRLDLQMAEGGGGARRQGTGGCSCRRGGNGGRGRITLIPNKRWLRLCHLTAPADLSAAGPRVRCGGNGACVAGPNPTPDIKIHEAHFPRRGRASTEMASPVGMEIDQAPVSEASHQCARCGKKGDDDDEPADLFQSG